MSEIVIIVAFYAQHWRIDRPGRGYALAGASGTTPFSDLTFNVTRKYLPAAERSKLATLTLTRRPVGAERRTIKMRNAIEKLFQFEVGIQKLLMPACDPETAAGNTELDALMAFSEQAANFFEPTGAQAGMIGQAQWVDSEIPLTYDPQHLLNLRTFTTYVVFTVRYYEEIVMATASWTAKLYYLSTGTRASWGDPDAEGRAGGAAPDDLLEAPNVGDITIPLEKNKVDITKRVHGGVRAYKGTLKDAEITIPMNYKATDACYVKLLTAFLKDETVALAFLGGDSATAGVEGLWGDFEVLVIEKGEKIDGVQMVDIKVAPGDTPVPMEWIVVTA